MKVKSLSRVQLFAIPRTAAYQAPPPMGFSRQEYWSGVPLPSPPKAEREPNHYGKRGGPDKRLLQKSMFAGLPWWFTGLESTCQCKGHRFEPLSRRIYHILQSNHAQVLQLLKPVLWRLQATTTEAHVS